MGKLKYLIIHCTETPPGRHITGDDIIAWHMSSKEDGGRGWNRLGYSDLIRLDGVIENLTPYNEDDEITNAEMTWGAKGVNSLSRHVCYVGGKCEYGLSSLSDDQFFLLQRYVKDFLHHHPDCKIAGHNQFSTKACPNFDVKEFCELIGIPKENIYEVNR